MYAVIETGGKQYRVSEGDVIFIEKLDVEANATALKNGKGKKITVFTYKPKKSSSRKMGHRQAYTQVRIESIQA